MIFDIHPYGTSAEDQITGWPTGLPCWQVQITHTAYPSMTAFFLEAFDAFLADNAAESGAAKSLKEFQTQCFFRVQITRADDAEVPDVPLAPWRMAIYTAGRSEALSDLLGLLMTYARHRAEHLFSRDRKPFPDPDDQKFEVYMGTGCPQLSDKISEMENVEISCEGNLYKWCEAAGPIGNKFLFMDLEVEKSGAVALGWRGRTWPLRNAFEVAEVPLVEDGKGGFFRVLRGEQAAISSETERQKIIDLVKSGLNHFPTIVLAETIPEAIGKPSEDVYADARALLVMLRAVPHVYVKEIARDEP